MNAYNVVLYQMIFPFSSQIKIGICAFCVKLRAIVPKIESLISAKFPFVIRVRMIAITAMQIKTNEYAPSAPKMITVCDMLVRFINIAETANTITAKDAQTIVATGIR